MDGDARAWPPVGRMRRVTRLGAFLAALAAVLAILSSLDLASDRPSNASAWRPAVSRVGANAPSEAAREISIAWAGDVTPGSRYGIPPNGGRAQFTGVRGPLRRVDLALGNLEGTFSVGGRSKCATEGGTCFSFQAPPGRAAALRWAGFDLLNLANNHALDFGLPGQRQTVAALDRHHLGHTGRPGEIEVMRRRGLRIAIVGFAPYRWASDMRDRTKVRRLVAAAAKRSDIVIVLAHIGAEGSDKTHVPRGREVALGEDRGATRAFAHAAVKAGADLVLGSGPHVLRGIELYRGKLIAYSLGNFAGWRNFSAVGALSMSGLLTVRLSGRGHVRGGAFLPLRLTGVGVPARDRSGAATRLVNALSRADFGDAGLRLLRNGSF
jgi:Bacterial capsule synthesis protein PGA_cap